MGVLQDNPNNDDGGWWWLDKNIQIEVVPTYLLTIHTHKYKYKSKQTQIDENNNNNNNIIEEIHSNT